ncbi:hypothetical protein ABKV19_027010 [Rosa sericea]
MIGKEIADVHKREFSRHHLSRSLTRLNVILHINFYKTISELSILGTVCRRILQLSCIQVCCRKTEATITDFADIE